jgi:NADPH:quinone reductase-like Zn-dependent oxidoreductase
VSKASVLTQFGGPEVLQWLDVETPVPAAGEILVHVKAAGVGPTDLNIRAGHLAQVFPQKAGSVLGFEAAGTVVGLGTGVTGIRVGDDVAVQLSAQGGYAEFVTATVWFAKPDSVSWTDAAALPASAEAAVGTLREINATSGETLVVLGAAGAVGQIATQIAVAQGLRVIGAASATDAELVRSLGADPVEYGDGVFDRVAAIASRVDAVIDAAGHGALIEAVHATGNPDRVVTLADPRGAGESGAKMSEPGPKRAPDALSVTMPLLESGALKLKRSRTVSMVDAAEAHRLLDSGETHDKIVLTTP